MAESKVGLIARREWFENVRTKTFWISLLLLPVILVASFIVPVVLERNKPARDYAVIDHSGWLLQAVEDRAMAADLARLTQAEPDALPRALGENPAADPFWQDWWQNLSVEAAREINPGLSRARYRRIDNEPSIDALTAQVADDDLFAYFELAATPEALGAVNRYVSKNLTDNDLERWFTRLAEDAVRDRRLAAYDVDPELAVVLKSGLAFTRSKITSSGEEADVSIEDRLRQWAPLVFVYLLFLSIFTVSQMLLSNTIEEKSNRLMEVLLSSVSPLQLMIGKILGIAATGLTMVITWAACLTLAAMAAPAVFAGTKLDVDLSFVFGEPVYMASFLVYFVLGYLFYASVLVAIGSVCNTLKEAQNLQAPVTIIIIIPLFLMVPIGQDPNGLIARIFSYFPPTTPFVMMNRAAGDLPWWEYALTIGLLAASVAGAMWAAAKVFRVGVLMTGKPPSLRELVRMVRAR